MAAGEERDDGERGHTLELKTDQSTTRLPSVAGDLREQLPGLEPERHLSDWGRSERVEGLIDRTVYDFLYRYWFRVEVEGIENVPDEGGALLVANHAGALPGDGVMIAKAIREEHQRPRPVHFTTAQRFMSAPGLGMLLVKAGGVPEHPSNLHRLLFDERQLVLVFPEGRGGAGKPIKERYRLRRFDPTGFVDAALRARVPIVPIAVLGSEEAVPVLARLGFLGALTRIPKLPLTTGVPLPAKFRIRFLEAIEPNGGEQPLWEDEALVQTLGRDIRALIQENLLEMVSHRRSVWLG